MQLRFTKMFKYTISSSNKYIESGNKIQGGGFYVFTGKANRDGYSIFRLEMGSIRWHLPNRADVDSRTMIRRWIYRRSAPSPFLFSATVFVPLSSDKI